jgi:hypothetical protein
MKEKTLPRPLPELAKSVWKAQRRPSARKVARALSQAGHPIHFTTINRWRSQGWRGVKGEHPIDAARANLDSAVPILTGDPSTTAEDMVKHNEAKPELEQLSDKQLLSAVARQALVTITLIEEVFNAQLPKLLEERPAETAVLVGALAVLIEAATGALRQQAFTPPKS